MQGQSSSAMKGCTRITVGVIGVLFVVSVYRSASFIAVSIKNNYQSARKLQTTLSHRFRLELNAFISQINCGIFDQVIL